VLISLSASPTELFSILLMIGIFSIWRLPIDRAKFDVISIDLIDLWESDEPDGVGSAGRDFPISRKFGE
jgi:hypothetical protein